MAAMLGSYREHLPKNGIRAEEVESWHRGKKWVLEKSFESLPHDVPEHLKFLGPGDNIFLFWFRPVWVEYSVTCNGKNPSVYTWVVKFFRQVQRVSTG